MNRAQRALIPKDDGNIWFMSVWLLACVLFLAQGTIGFGEELDIVCCALAVVIFLVVYVMATVLSILAMLSLHSDILRYLENGPPSYVLGHWITVVKNGAKMLRIGRAKSIIMFALIMPVSMGVAGWFLFAVFAFIATLVYEVVRADITKSVVKLLSTLTNEQIMTIMNYEESGD